MQENDSKIKLMVKRKFMILRQLKVRRIIYLKEKGSEVIEYKWSDRSKYTGYLINSIVKELYFHTIDRADMVYGRMVKGKRLNYYLNL